MCIIQFLNENAPFITALAAATQAAFALILVMVYVKRQTNIMEVQKAILSLQLLPEKTRARMMFITDESSGGKLYDQALADLLHKSVLKILDIEIKSTSSPAEDKKNAP